MFKKTPAILNIGLNVGNKEPHDQYLSTLRLFNHSRTKVVYGEWDGIKERTLVLEIPDINKADLKHACVMLRQECIAVKTHNGGYLVMNPHSKESYEFNEEFFHDL